MKNLKKFFGFVVAFSMTLSLSGVVSTPILAVEENTDQVTEDQTVTETPTEEKKDEADTGEAPVTDEIQGEVVTEQPTTPESDNTEELSETDVAQIGDVTYPTLDEAVTAATDGATITILKDCTTEGLNLSKNLTIAGLDGTKPTINFTKYGIALWGKALTFENCNVTMKGIGSTPYTAEWGWMTICASVGASLSLNNVDMTMDATDAKNSPHAIYFCQDNVLNVNNSNLTIKNYPNDALEWDGGNGGYNINITNSTFLSDHNRSGFTGTFVATIDNSVVDVVNSTGNGSNGSDFIIRDCNKENGKYVNFSNNGSHGLSAGELSITDSDVTANNNKGMGIAVNKDLKVINSNVTVEGNASNSSYGYAAVRLYNNYDFLVDATSSFHINNNSNTGLYVRQGELTVEEGADLEIIGNTVTHELLDGHGGGLYVGYGDNYDPTVILPSNVKIYNNIALDDSEKYKGDDIYVSEGVNGPTVTLPDAPKGAQLTARGENAEITNWFYDGANPNYEGKLGNAGKTARWDMDSYVKLYAYNDTTKTITGEIGLKAAYAPATTFTPIDLTMYVGGEGYENVDSVADNDKKNGFPEPGYYVTLPKEINNAIQSNGQPVDLSEETNNFSFEYTYNYNNGEELRHWKMTKYTDADGSESTKDGNYVYSLALADGRKPTLRVIDDAGNIQTNANFDLTNAVNKVYTTMVGSVEGDSFTSGEINESKSLTANVQTDAIDVDFDRTVIATGKLYVRGVVNVTDENLTTSIQKEGTEPKAGVPMATVPEGTNFYINGEEGLEVQKNADPSLLYDDILPEGNDANNDRRIGWLKDKAEQLCNQYGLLEQAGITNPQYSFKYMDIVDQNNGNVVLKADKNVTVYMPYPEGVDKDTSIIVLHYKDLNRDMTYDDVQSAIMNCEMEKMTVTQLDDHIEFETTSFSPFVVIWGTDEAGEIVKNKDRADTGLFQNAPLYIALMTACASLVAIIAIKRRIDAK
ncbi:right-handed parallel beta-helix repeat-containing protein [Faecalitalea cylindroides]|uniref:right-handed parallel beta-helix repeat-containing protein n=1 Tax=Faecalitalea cylindroides TaxID=39483 RepID=UPI000B39ADF6|nr:right-handed parallel beta-helix repeat-containing protein [Faecalitalea cylindroides]OUN60853.1 hypothetical protein B5G15_06925 [Faecalitalea cylindroides]